MRGMHVGMLGWCIVLGVGCEGTTPLPQPPPEPTVARLVFRSGAQSIDTGGCSAPVVLELQDDGGTPVAAPDDVEVGLDTEPGVPLTLYADASCATPLTRLVFSAGATQASFHFTSTVAGRRTLVATATGSTATQEQMVRAWPIAGFTWEPIADAHVNVPFEIIVHGADAYGNPIDVENIGLGVEPSMGFGCSDGCGRSATARFIAGTFRAKLTLFGPASGVRVRLFLGSLTSYSPSFAVR